MNQILASLRSMKIDETDIQTANFQIAPRYDTGQNNQGPPKIAGYEVSNRYRGRARAAEAAVPRRHRAGRLETISSIAFSFANPEQYEDEARVRAVADARHKAGVYSAASGVQLGVVQSISESTAIGPPVPVVCQADARRSRRAGAVAAGESVIQSHVTIVWEIK